MFGGEIETFGSRQSFGHCHQRKHALTVGKSVEDPKCVILGKAKSDSFSCLAEGLRGPGLSGDLHPRSNIDICVPLLMAFWIKDNFGVKTNPHRGCEKCDNYCIKFTCDTYLM